MKRISLFLGALALLGAGCASGGSIQHPPADLALDSEFTGIDGSLTQDAFDQVADAFMTWVFDNEHDLNVEVPLTDRFVEWRELTGDQYPSFDTFNNEIQISVPEVEESVIQLMSAGADGEVGTEDDYRKHYPYRQR